MRFYHCICLTSLHLLYAIKFAVEILQVLKDLHGLNTVLGTAQVNYCCHSVSRPTLVATPLNRAVCQHWLKQRRQLFAEHLCQ